MSLDLDDLARKALNDGDPVAWRDLFQAVTPRLFGWVRRLGTRPEEAEDLVQQTWLKVVDAGYDRGPFLAFVLRISKNLWIDELRKRNRRPGNEPFSDDGPPGHDPQPVDWLVALENVEEIRRCLERLASLDRQLIVWHFGEEALAHAEIAARLGKTESQVKGLCYRASRSLLRCLDLEAPPKKMRRRRERKDRNDVSPGGDGGRRALESPADE